MSAPKDVKIKTKEGFIMKIIIELYENFVHLCTFSLDKNKWKINEVDEDRKVFISSEFSGSNFDEFKVDEPCHLPVNLEHMKKIVSSMKKKNSFAMVRFIKERDNLYIKTKDPETSKEGGGRVVIFPDEPVKEISDWPDISDLHPACIVNNAEFRRSCKSMNGSGKSVRIEGQANAVRFCSVDTLYDKTEKFGKWKKDEDIIFSTEIETKQLVNLTKCAGLSSKLKLYCLPEAFVIAIDAGHLGSVKIYLKSDKN